MSLDVRTRSAGDGRPLGLDEMLDGLLPRAIAVHGDLAARGVVSQGLPTLGFEVGHEGFTLSVVAGTIEIRSGTAPAGVVAALEPDALSDLLADTVSTMGLAMTARVKIVAGSINDWIGWEPVLRALLDGRKVHEPGDIDFVDRDGAPLDLARSFTPDDDREEIAHFLHQAGFLHLRAVFTETEMAALSDDIEEWLARATPDDGDSWWGTTADGTDVPVRVLNFHEKSESLRGLVADDRYRWIGELTGDGHVHGGGGEGLTKPLGIVRGLSDLPWHKDCGQGEHSYRCSGLTCGISVTGADRVSGALGVIPGTHRANTMATGRDPKLDLQPRMLETETGDITVHCSDTLHRAHPPVERPRKVVYSGFVLPPRPGEARVPVDRTAVRTQRAGLSDVQSRIEAADNEAAPDRYRARRSPAND